MYNKLTRTNYPLWLTESLQSKSIVDPMEISTKIEEKNSKIQMESQETKGDKNVLQKRSRYGCMEFLISKSKTRYKTNEQISAYIC